jgi:hypothetical protein
LLKKLLGSHSGVFVKLCAITDKYTLETRPQTGVFENSTPRVVRRQGVLDLTITPRLAQS